MKPAAASLEKDVVVVGAGVAGMLAALRARARGKSVLVVGRPAGASLAWSGAVDVADALHQVVPGNAASALDRGGDIDDAVAALAQSKPRHPYARLGAQREQMASALQFFVDAVPELALVRRDDKKNHVLATQLGSVKRAALVPASQHLDVAALGDGDVLGVVEWQDLAHFGARPVREMLRFVLDHGPRPRATRVVDVVVPRMFGGDFFRSTTDFARALDDAATREKVLGALATRLGQIDAQPTHLLMPPALTSTPTRALLTEIDARLKRPLRELLALPPSLPGTRLWQALLAAAHKAGVDVVEGVVEAPVVAAGRVQEFTVVRGGERQRVTAKAVVLATGRFLGGGIVRDHAAREPLFGFPVVADGLPVADQFIGSLTADHVDGDHAIFRAGVVTDDQLRPMAGPKVACDNVFCAGTVVGGFDPARDGAALGVSVWLGVLAGNRAADAA